MDDLHTLVIAEGDIAEADPPLHMLGGCGRFGNGFLLGFFQKRKHTLCRCRHGLHHGHHLPQLIDGTGEVADIVHKCLNVADANDPANGQHRAADNHSHIAQIADEPVERNHHTAEKLALPAGFIQCLVGLVKLRQHRLLAVIGLHHVQTAEGLLNGAVDIPQQLLLCHKLGLALFHHDQHDHQAGRQHQSSDPRHQGRDAQHHDHGAHQRADAVHQSIGAAVKPLTEGIHIIGNAGQHIANGVLLEILHGHPPDLLVQLLAQTVGGVLHDLGHGNGGQEAAQLTEAVNGNDPQQNGADGSEINAARAHGHSHGSLKQHRGGLPQNLGTLHGKYHGDRRQQTHQQQQISVRADVADDFLDRTLKVLCLFKGHTGRAAMPPSARRTTFFLTFSHYASTSSPSSFSDSWLTAISR